MRPDRSADPRLVHTVGADRAVLLALATELAEGAGRRVRAARSRRFEVSAKSTPTDLVTAVDTETEAWIAEQIRAQRPGDELLGEEAGAQTIRPAAGAGAQHGQHGPDSDRVRWIVDPIDGTVNFALGIPAYAVSVAAEVGGTVVAGCVYNPESDETFRAALGSGAELVSPGVSGGRVTRRLGERRTVPLDRAVIGTGFGYEAARRARQGAAVARLMPRIGDIRRIGAASLDLCSVAAGRLDGYFEAGLHRWDWAAGALIVEESGAALTGAGADSAPGDGMVVAAGPELLPGLVEALRDAGAFAVL